MQVGKYLHRMPKHIKHPRKDIDMGSGPTIIPLRRIAVVAAAAVTALLFAPLAPANADQAPQESMVVFSAEEIANSATPADDTVASALDAQMRNGVLQDSARMNSATFTDPNLDTGEITLAWSDSTTMASLKMGSAISTDGTMQRVGFGVESYENPEAAAPLHSDGNGYARIGGYDGSGFYEAGWDCAYVEKHHMPPANDTPNSLESCWQKLAKAGTDEWIYNRWSTLTLGYSDTWRYKVNDFTIRARPWSESTAVNRLRDPQPSVNTEDCTNVASFTISGLSVPINNCVPTTVAHRETSMIGTDGYPLDIGVKTDNPRPAHDAVDRTRALHTAGNYQAVDEFVVPVFADYNWIELHACTEDQWGGWESCWWYDEEPDWLTDAGW